MTTNTFLSAVATGILALATGGHAIAADVAGTTSAVKTATAAPERFKVELHFAGAEKVTFYDSGTFQIHKADGSVWRYRPNLTQNVKGKRKFLNPEYRIVGKDRIAVTADPVDPTAPVLVDGKGPNS